jgi:hypothetical protein
MYTRISIALGMGAFFIPLIIGSSVNPANPRIVALALPCVMITLCLPLLLTGLFPHMIRLPIRVSSFPHWTPLPPLAYVYVEDVIAVDGGGATEFRQVCRLDLLPGLLELILAAGMASPLRGVANHSSSHPSDVAFVGLEWLHSRYCAHRSRLALSHRRRVRRLLRPAVALGDDHRGAHRAPVPHTTRPRASRVAALSRCSPCAHASYPGGQVRPAGTGEPPRELPPNTTSRDGRRRAA